MYEGSLPTTADKAVLNWQTWARPTRNGENIILPLERLREVHPVQNGKSYLAVYGAERRFSVSAGGALFFGTDEQPFLTGISGRAVKVFKTQGEQAFFRSLQPVIINELVAINGQPIVRQGDIYALKIGNDWREAMDFLRNPNQAAYNLKIQDARIQQVVSRSLFNTRHKLQGQMMSVCKRVPKVPRGSARYSEYHFYLGQGRVSAPDHKPMDISDGIHVICRTPASFNPIWAIGAE